MRWIDISIGHVLFIFRLGCILVERAYGTFDENFSRDEKLISLQERSNLGRSPLRNDGDNKKRS